MKKNYFKKETFAEGDFCAFPIFGCNFIQNMLSAKSLCARNVSNWSSAKVFVHRMTKNFPNFLLVCHIFWNFLNCLLHWKVGCSRIGTRKLLHNFILYVIVKSLDEISQKKRKNSGFSAKVLFAERFMYTLDCFRTTSLRHFQLF